MFPSITMISTLVAMVLSLLHQINAYIGAHLHDETTRTTQSRPTSENSQPDVAGSDQHVISESVPPEGSPNSSQIIPLSVREHWMRHANHVLRGLGSPCPFAAFASIIVNHTDTSSSPLGRFVCIGVNSGSRRGNPILHGEIDAINRCSEVLQGPHFGLTSKEARLAFRDLTIYTNAEPCSMCASAIRWAGFRECVYGTSIETLVRLGWPQIGVSSREIFARSGLLPSTTALIPDVLTAETDPGIINTRHESIC
ncbi:cytidine deaminase-like protein [Nemania abortiva]|nr:cytidine deaminase-like protein [Nemania abortiva]